MKDTIKYYKECFYEDKSNQINDAKARQLQESILIVFLSLLCSYFCYRSFYVQISHLCLPIVKELNVPSISKYPLLYSTLSLPILFLKSFKSSRAFIFNLQEDRFKIFFLHYTTKAAGNYLTRFFVVSLNKIIYWITSHDNSTRIPIKIILAIVTLNIGQNSEVNSLITFLSFSLIITLAFVFSFNFFFSVILPYCPQPTNRKIKEDQIFNWAKRITQDFRLLFLVMQV